MKRVLLYLLMFIVGVIAAPFTPSTLGDRR
jgi:uncharacterized protein HemY